MIKNILLVLYDCKYAIIHSYTVLNLRPGQSYWQQLLTSD